MPNSTYRRSDIPATGRRIREPFTVVYHVEDGEFISAHLYYDRAGLLAQLGRLPDSLSA